MSTSLPKISLTSYILGALTGASLYSALTTYKESFPALQIYFVFVTLFHFLEFYITAIYQPSRVNDSSFVLDNYAYHAAHAFAITEYFIESFLNLKFKNVNFQIIGILLIASSQIVRSLAMITAAENFSHIIAREREKSHSLITHGIYKYLRHPSYVGFYYWALSTQLLLLNPVSFFLFAILVHSFFSERIPYEEYHLIKFFGNDYLNYKDKTYIGLPFIKKLPIPNKK